MCMIWETDSAEILLLCRTDAAQHVSGITMPIVRSPSNCRCSLWFPYECGGGRVLSHGQFVHKPTTAENTSTSTFIRKPEAATAVWRAPDDGHCNARNMLSSVCTKKQSILRLIVASSLVFYLSDWRCTEPQTLNTKIVVSYLIRDCSVSYIHYCKYRIPNNREAI